MSTTTAPWTPLALASLRVGDLLEWRSSSSPTGLRRQYVKDMHATWLFVGDQLTPREQDWLDNPHIQVRKLAQV